MYTEQRLKNEVEQGLEECVHLIKSQNVSWTALAAILQQTANYAHQMNGARERTAEFISQGK